MNITSQTARALRLSRPRVQPISSISADGVTFVREPAAFRAEVVLQAGELYGGRGAVSMDADRLLRGAGLAAATLPDIPDFRCRMGAALSCHPPGCADEPVSVEELRPLLLRGSTATALDELPRSVLQHVGGHGHAAVVALVRAVDGTGAASLLRALAGPDMSPPAPEAHRVPQLPPGPPSCAPAPAWPAPGVLHLPLKKKEPAWLLRNSRPVLLEPFLCRAEATAVFRRLQTRAEAAGLFPAGVFAYRRQVPAQLAGQVGRLLVAAWASAEGEVFVADWDESNAFCNIPWDGAAALLEPLLPGLGAWMRRFYARMEVRVVTPFGLTDPYGLVHSPARPGPSSRGFRGCPPPPPGAVFSPPPSVCLGLCTGRPGLRRGPR